MTDIGRFREQMRNREPDWRGRSQKRFRWRTLRREYGRWCFIVAPVEGVHDFSWWEWENGNGTVE